VPIIWAEGPGAGDSVTLSPAHDMISRDRFGRSVVVWVDGEDPMLTAAEAARALGRHPGTAHVLAVRLYGKDPRLLRIGGRWAAPLSWWREVLAEVPKRGKRGQGRQPKPRRRPAKAGE
jgi:hypothetical protein